MYIYAHCCTQLTHLALISSHVTLACIPCRMMEDELAQLVHSNIFIPTIVLIATDSLKAKLFSSTNLDLVSLFSPFGGFYTPLTCRYRVLDRALQQDAFKVRFVFPDGSRNVVPVDATNFESWFGSYCGELGGGDYDCLQQPIATILLVSSDDENPVDCFEQLSHVSHQSLLCRQGVLDPTSVRIKMLVHDMSSSSSLLSAESILSQLRAMYAPSSVIFLPINSGDGGGVSNLFGEGKGAGLSWEDVGRLNSAIECVVCENAIPWMERKLSQLDANITAKRKGLRNQFKNFMRAGGSTGGTILLSQVEWQCRLAGDLAFFLRAYELAFGYYRNVCGDLKTDRMFAQAAGCYEMSGLTGYLCGGPQLPEISRFFDSSFELYRMAKLDALAIRSAILHSYILRGRSEAGEKLITANGEVPDAGLRCAMLLDRAALLHELAGHSRKAGFTKVLAGHMFNKVDGMKETALACYQSVLPMYTNHGWDFISDHLLFTIAKLEFGLGRFENSLSRLNELLNDQGPAHGTPDKHGNYMKLLTYVGKSVHGLTDTPVPKFTAPVVHESFQIHTILQNPLLCEIEVGNITFKFANSGSECEISGSIVLAPLEYKQLELECTLENEGDGPVSIEWTLGGTLACSHRF